MNRPKNVTGNRVIPLEKVNLFEKIPSFLQNYNITTFLIGGSLLGWRRECTIIPHTHDLDFLIRSEDLTEKIVEEIGKEFKLIHKIGENLINF